MEDENDTETTEDREDQEELDEYLTEETTPVKETTNVVDEDPKKDYFDDDFEPEDEKEEAKEEEKPDAELPISPKEPEQVVEENEDSEEPSMDRVLEKNINKGEIIRMFSKTEIMEINQYISTNVPFSILSQQFAMTEKPIPKAQIYTTVYRFITSAAHYVASDVTRKKLNKLLKETEVEYQEIYERLARYQNTRVNFNRHRDEYKIMCYFTDQKCNSKINKIIDAFLVFAEKQELLDLNKVAGLDLDNEMGQKALKDIATGEEVKE